MKKGKVNCGGDLSIVVFETQLWLLTWLMRFFFCLWQFLDLHHLRDFNLDIDQGKCNGLYAICTNYPSKIRWRRLKFEFGWWQLSDCSKTLSALSRNWHMCNTYILKWIQCILSYNIEWKVKTCIRKFSEYGSLDYPYQFNAGNIYRNLATPPPPFQIMLAIIKWKVGRNMYKKIKRSWNTVALIDVKAGFI